MKGGMELHIKNLTLYQLNNGHQVTVAFNTGEKITDNDVQILRGIPVYKIKPQAFGFLLFYFCLCIRLIFKPLKCDVIHIHGDWSSLVFASWIKKMTHSQKNVFSCHTELKNNTFYRYIMAAVGKKIDTGFSTSYNTHLYLQDWLGKSVYFQPSGIREKFITQDFPSRSKKIISVCNLEKRKNIDLILSIAETLKEYSFEIIGKGSDKERLEEIKQTKNIKNVDFAGYKDLNYIYEKLLYSSIFLLTSIEEGTSTAMIEAMAVGLPVVVSSAGGSSAVIEEDINGYVIDSFDKNEYVEKIKLLANNKDLWQKISVNNKEKGKSFSWNNVGKNITDKFEKLLTK
jgi:glycosyltransferase involved in cell wall biosynthesis